MAAETAPPPAPSARPHRSRAGIVTGLTFALALVVVLVVRGNAVVGIAVLFLVFVPLEKLFALRPQRVFRAGFVTDLTHLLVNNLLVTAATVVLVIVAALPLIWIRSFGLQSHLPAVVAIAVALVTVLVGNYWVHRLTHQVPLLWRFRAVHHSIERTDWVASGRLHPLDSAFTQAFALIPVFLLGYGPGTFAGLTIFFTLLALFQHANVRFVPDVA
jgi:sterol desaturase/sphingolipid hydroxylase (fatty acid hydroxylase superfamily)